MATQNQRRSAYGKVWLFFYVLLANFWDFNIFWTIFAHSMATTTFYRTTRLNLSINGISTCAL